MENEIFIFRSKSKTGIQRVRKVHGETFELAKEKAILNFSNILYSKQKPMDLITAIQRAKKASLTAKKAYYIIAEEDGECSVSTAPLSGVTHKFTNGEMDKGFKPHDSDSKSLFNKSSNSEFVDIGKGKVPAQSEKAKKLIEKKRPSEIIMEEAEEIERKENKTKQNMKKTEKKAAKKVAKKAVKGTRNTHKAQSSNGAVRALDAPIKGGAAKIILDAIKKNAQTKEQLAKLAKTKLTNVGWYLNKIKNNGHAVKLTDKGYKI